MCLCVVMAVVIYRPCTIRPCLCLLRLGLLGTGNVSHSLAVPVGPTAAASTRELGAAWESAVRRQGTAVAGGPPLGRPPRGLGRLSASLRVSIQSHHLHAGGVKSWS